MTEQNGDLVLVTGASGFVGSSVARIAQQKGFKVRVLVRATSPRQNIESLDAEIVVGDMRDEASMRNALRGVRYLLHVAADYRLWAPDPSEIERSNLEGTEATMRAALNEGVERIVYTSSVATLKVTSAGTSADETSPLEAEQAIGVYKRSKVLAERAVERMIAERRPAGGDRQPVDADRPARRQADADRAHHRRSGARQDSRFRRYGPEPRARRRRRGRPFPGAGTRQDRRTLYPWRRKSAACSRCSRISPR